MKITPKRFEYLSDLVIIGTPLPTGFANAAAEAGLVRLGHRYRAGVDATLTTEGRQAVVDVCEVRIAEIRAAISKRNAEIVTWSRSVPLPLQDSDKARALLRIIVSDARDQLDWYAWADWEIARYERLITRVSVDDADGAT